MESEVTQTALLQLAPVYQRWEEVYVSSDKGKREVHYYLKRKSGGGSDLAVIGKEKTLRHMTYHYAFKERFLLSNIDYSSLPKLRSRREVVDWLNSICNPVSDLELPRSIKHEGTCVESKNVTNVDVNTVQDVHLQKLCQQGKHFMWLGSPWTCRKRRRHYQSFCRNGVEIAVHDFIFVLAEEDERLVAHLDDMYEDSKGNKMVVVRWFHKIDEVGTVLPQNYNDREIFFSLCLQDLSIECIDGLATVLSPEHYEKFLNEAKYTQLEPFICHRQFDNDEVKPLDITQVKGYWKQDALQYMSFSSPLRLWPSDDCLKVEGNSSDAAGRPKKRLCRSQDYDTYLQSAGGKADVAATLPDGIGSSRTCKGVLGMSGLKEGLPAAPIVKSAIELQQVQHLSIGCRVEVLSQDSGIRGCWFRALILKKHKDKVKVQYEDIKDAADEEKNLEEWVLASRLATPDDFGLRMCGRTIVRPAPLSNKGKVAWVFNIGTSVDVWWNDGWWEGIVVKRESEDRLHIYFPGEKQELVFGSGDLRHSQEWLENEWKQLRERSDLVPVITGVEIKQDIVSSADVKSEKAAHSRDRNLSKSSLGDVRLDELKAKAVRDLSKDDLLSKLRWKSSRRRRVRSPVRKVHYAIQDGTKNWVEDTQTYERFFMPSSLKVDPDNCKYNSDTLFNSSAVTPFTNLVMSR